MWRSPSMGDNCPAKNGRVDPSNQSSSLKNQETTVVTGIFSIVPNPCLTISHHVYPVRSKHPFSIDHKKLLDTTLLPPKSIVGIDHSEVLTIAEPKKLVITGDYHFKGWLQSFPISQPFIADH